jgi:hypothetical protein
MRLTARSNERMISFLMLHGMTRHQAILHLTT